MGFFDTCQMPLIPTVSSLKLMEITMVYFSERSVIYLYLNDDAYVTQNLVIIKSIG